MIRNETLQFLADVSRNRDAEWIARHRPEFRGAKADLTRFAVSVLKQLAAMDRRVIVANPDPRKCISLFPRGRMHSSQFSMVIRVAPTPSASATYFVDLQPGRCYSGGGLRSPTSELSRLFRQKMMTDTGRWREIVEGRVFRKFFPAGLTDGEETLARAPLNNHDALDSLNLRSFGACHHLPDALIQSPEAISQIVRSFAAARPLVDYINRAAMA